MAEAWEIVNKFILPFFNFLKMIINAFSKLLTGETKFPE